MGLFEVMIKSFHIRKLILISKCPFVLDYIESTHTHEAIMAPSIGLCYLD